VQAVIDEHGHVLCGIKVDGIRAHLFRRDSKLHIVTRAGHEILAMSEWHERILGTWDVIGFSPEAVLDCELHIPGVDFQKTSGLLRRNDPLGEEYGPQFVILDVYGMDHLLGNKADSPAFGHRLTSIARKLNGKTLLDSAEIFVGEALTAAYTLDGVRGAYKDARGMGYEGVIVKDPRAEVRNGKVAGFWKLKPGCGMPGWEGDGVVIGYVWGDADKANAGKIVGFRVRLDDGSESNATGLTQAQMEELTAEYNHWGISAHMGRIARIEAMERTNGGSLRHPRFIGFRDLDSAPGDLV
jgi:ATP-dependent DNA ligase